MARKKAIVNAVTTSNGKTGGVGLSSRDYANGFLKRLGASLSAHRHKSTKGWMYETINPLWNISTKQAQMIFDLARSGNYAQLEYLYNEIETCSPVFSVCVTRRCAAVSELDWKVVRSDERKYRNADENLVKEQIECIETAIAKIDNFPEALDHLALAAFRGFSIVNVWRDTDGNTPKHLETLDQWNCCHDKRHNKWLWNPDAISFMNPTLSDSKLDEIPRDDAIIVTRKRQIDWPALKIFLRESVGERDWGRFLETYGLPPVIITMPEFTSKEEEDDYVATAADVFEGRSGVVPAGSEVNFASESRGVNPFTEFIDHQMKLFVLLATGGTLTSLSEAQGIGSGASDAQMDVWKQIVRSDVRIISNAINKQLCEPLLKAQKDFKGKPILAEFKLNTEPAMTADQILDLAGKAASAGLELDEKEISKICGFTVRKKVEGGGMGFNAEAPSGGGSSMVSPGLTFQADEEIDEATTAVNAHKTASVEVLNAKGKDGRGERKRVVGANSEPTRKAKEVGERLVESLQADFKDVADEIGKILALPESEQAEAARVLLGKIDTLVPDDPAMAEVIEEQMREAFERQLAKEPEGKEPAKNKVVPNSKI